MPPFLPRKRLRSPSPEAGPSQPPPKKSQKGKAKTISTTPRKHTLFDDLDAGTGRKRTPEHTKAALKALAEADDEDESSLSSLSSEDEFEDVPDTKRQKTGHNGDAGEEEDSDEDLEFEDVETNGAPAPSGPEPSGDLELTLQRNPTVSHTDFFGKKKGPSKIERQVRTGTHQLHVMFLMWHNAVRNSWLCDCELQDILVKGLSPGVAGQVEKWRVKSGLVGKKDETPKGKGKGKGKVKKANWEEPAQVVPDGHDPIFQLLKVLLGYWKQRFRITAPGLRKLGYMSLQRLEEESKSFKNDEHDPERHGERFRDIEEFKKAAEAAEAMEGSRDVGAQLFTALLRGLGIEARMVANLQPCGFGWTKHEEAFEKNPRVLKKPKPVSRGNLEHSSESEDTSEDEEPAPPPSKKGKGKAPAKANKAPPKKGSKPARRSTRGGHEDTPIEVSKVENSAAESDEESVIDVTPARKSTNPSLPYDQDLLYPHYWTEVLSPVTNTYTPIDPIVLRLIAKTQKEVELFEPRGAKSEKAKQVTTYIIAHSPDGTAKDVTTRYLKSHIWPGRTKGSRFPVEKIAIRNKHGKVKSYQEFDWFKTVMRGYSRGSKECPRTEIDDYEEAIDLKIVKREKKEVEEGKETLQYYKSSPDFVLERHLKREEALIPGAKHIKLFTIKGKGETSTEEKVFSRKDVVNCKSMETWHKEGRAPKEGEEPLKRVPYRAATTNRRRELAEAEQANGGEKVLQGLFSLQQTDWIIPPPIQNGIVPKNSFGNIDLYVESMLPEGAVHIPMRGTMKICKRLNIDYAEAVTGFEFGHRMAVPIISGVVVAEEHYDDVMEQWYKDEEERTRKEDEKRRRVAVGMWRKMVMGLRIVERVKEEYGDLMGEGEGEGEVNPFGKSEVMVRNGDHELEEEKRRMDQRDEEMAGGFLPEGFDAEEVEQGRRSSFFLVANHNDEEDDEEEGGGFVMEGHDEEEAEFEGKGKGKTAYPTPRSLEPSAKPETQKYEFVGDVGMDDGTSEVEDVEEIEVPKKHGRPAAKSKSKGKIPTPAASSKARTPAKRVAAPKSKTPASKTRGRPRKAQIPDSEEEEEDEESSSLSEVVADSELDEDEEEEEVLPTKKGRGRRVALPPKTNGSPRSVPKRRAARKSETALRSHYFEHSDGGENDD